MNMAVNMLVRNYSRKCEAAARFKENKNKNVEIRKGINNENKTKSESS